MIISITTSSSLPRMRATSFCTHTLMSGSLTLLMSTFCLNSGGKTVRIARASAPVFSFTDMPAGDVCAVREEWREAFGDPMVDEQVTKK